MLNGCSRQHKLVNPTVVEQHAEMSISDGMFIIINSFEWYDVRRGVTFLLDWAEAAPTNLANRQETG